eukprot:scaffold229172_cov23-Tisochrysis_lutea.AAC.2
MTGEKEGRSTGYGFVHSCTALVSDLPRLFSYDGPTAAGVSPSPPLRFGGVGSELSKTYF